MSARSPLILLANNPCGHHLLSSQLLANYRALDLDAEMILLCNGVAAGFEPEGEPSLKVMSFQSRFGGPFTFAKLFLLLIQIRWRYPKAAYHVRGFVSGAVFLLSRLGMLRSTRYIYDPRGAFFIEWREAGKSLLLSRIFGCFEAKLIKHSVATIVTSNGFARLYRMLFGLSEKYLTIYNSTNFAFAGANRKLPTKGPVRLIYMGTFNHWHDMDEVARVMRSAVKQIGPKRCEIFIYTSAKFHEPAGELFGAIECAKLHVGYVEYHQIPSELEDKHIGVSVVRPTLSTRIASPIKIPDYAAHGLLPLVNSGIGDFDRHFVEHKSAILYPFGGTIDMSDFDQVNTAANEAIYERVSARQAQATLKPAVENLLDG
jgi:hypothetical protein